ncbi:MAG: hypothetical protein UY35_C0016G0002 [Candidatus Saccharibacteria bacterium GW2011_GWC2_48_9]|nr:MAG: hypothetical protein UY35_C0016G0002 [Candidatus Saccharibacteria bacterium GW2011_GWC2_48_9]HCH34580.1 hypothetical protein [Candidatus Saccharibacteria bacterium]
MMRHVSVSRTILIAMLSILGVLVFSVNPTYASGETWWWDNNGSVLGMGGELGASGVRFQLTSADDSEYEGTINSSKQFPGTYVETSTCGRTACNTQTIDTVCTIKNPITISINRSSDPATVSVDRVAYQREGGGACTPNSPITIDGGAMKNSYGSNAANDQAAAYLESERGRLRQEYINQQCASFTGADRTSCENNSGKSFDARFESCKREASTSSNKAVIVENVRQCLKSKGIGTIDPDALNGAIYSVADYESQPSSCSLEWLGYIVCPASRFLATITDKAFEALQILFVIRPLAPESDAGAALYSAWAAMRNVANVAFIIAILMVVLSYVSNIGIDNYNIKRMLPRIIVAAILVNASYLICILAVDLANILGDSLQKVLLSMKPPGSEAGFGDSAWEGIVEGILAVGAVGGAVTAVALYGSFAALVPMLTAVALSLLLTVFLLTARYALILILIIIAPIAFVAYLLPNTQKWFSKWLSTFTTLLALYPIIAVIYGGSTLAGLIVINSAVETQGMSLLMFGLAIQALPLAITPLIMKLGGGILNRFGGVVSSKGLFKNTQKRADTFAKQAKNKRDIKGLRNIGDGARTGLRGQRDKAIQRRYRRSAISGLRQNELNKANRGYVSDYATGKEGSGGDATSLAESAKQRATGMLAKGGNKAAGLIGKDPGFEALQSKTKGEKYLQSMAGGDSPAALERVMANQQNEQEKMHIEEVKANKLVLANRGMDTVSDIAKGGGAGANDSALREAAMSLVLEHDDAKLIDQVMQSIGNTPGGPEVTPKQRAKYVKMLKSSGAVQRQAYYKTPGVLEKIESGSINANNFMQEVVAPSVENLTAKDFGNMDSHSINQVYTALAGSIDPATGARVEYVTDPVARDSAIKTAREALGNSYASQSLSSQARASLERVAGL